MKRSHHFEPTTGSGAERGAGGATTIGGGESGSAVDGGACGGGGGAVAADITGANDDATKTDDIGASDVISATEEALAKKLRLAVGGLVGNSVAALEMEARRRRASFWISWWVISKPVVVCGIERSTL